MRLYLLYGGWSEDGRGEATFDRVASSVEEARKWFRECNRDPFSTGHVTILTMASMRRALREEEIV